MTALRGRAAVLRFADVPPGTDLRVWQEFAEQVTTRARLADLATAAWARKEKREATWTDLHESARRVLDAVAVKTSTC